MKKRLSLEAISFQDGKFFQELTDVIGKIRNNTELFTMKSPEFFRSDTVSELGRVIKKYTNLGVEFKDGELTGFATEILWINSNHIFIDQDAVDMVMTFDQTADPQSTITKMLTSLNKKYIKGGVSLRESKVWGDYEKIPVVIYTPRNMLCDNLFFSPEECAAIILHEVGHSFISLEMVGRTVRTNQVLGGLSKCLGKSVTQEDRVAVYINTAKDLKMTSAQADALKDCKSEAQLATILLDAEITKSKSELGASIYDVNSCEMMADQFTSRHGAGKALVTGLEKLLTLYGQSRSGVFWGQIVGIMLSILVIMSLPGLGALLVLFLVIFGPDKSAQIYDKPLDRILRIKRDSIERLKSHDLSNVQRAQTLSTISAIEEVEARDNLPGELLWAEKVAYYLRPSYRTAHKYEMLQKELESFGNNNLFAKAAQLKSV